MVKVSARGTAVDVLPKKPLNGLLVFAALAAVPAASAALSGTASLTASLTPDAASEGLAGAACSTLSLAAAAGGVPQDH